MTLFRYAFELPVRTSGIRAARRVALSEGLRSSRVGRPATDPGMAQRSPFRHAPAQPEIIRLAVMLHARFPWSLKNVKELGALVYGEARILAPARQAKAKWG